MIAELREYGRLLLTRGHESLKRTCELGESGFGCCFFIIIIIVVSYLARWQGCKACAAPPPRRRRTHTHASERFEKLGLGWLSFFFAVLLSVVPRCSFRG